MPTIAPVYPADPPEQPQQQQPQSRIQRQKASEDLTQSLGLDSHQQPQPQPQPQKSSADLTETCTQDETWEERWKRELDEESSIEEDTQQYCMRILTEEEQDFPHGKNTCHCFQFSQERRTANLMDCISHMERIEAAVAEQEEEDSWINESDESLDATQILYEPLDLGAPRMCCSSRKSDEAAAAEQDSQHEKAAEFDKVTHTLQHILASHPPSPQHQEHALRVEDTQPDTQQDTQQHKECRGADVMLGSDVSDDTQKTWTPRSFSWSSPQEDQDTQDSLMVWPDTQADQDSQDSVEVLLMDLPDTCTGLRSCGNYGSC